MKRHRAFKLLLFVFAGAIINVAVAWAIGYMIDVRILVHFMRPDKCYRVGQGCEFRLGRTELRLASWGRSDENNFSPEIEAMFPKWSVFASGTKAESFDDVLPERTHRAFFEYASGWPTLSLRSFHRAALVRVGEYAWVNGSGILPAVRLPEGHSERRGGASLPLHPIFPGFAINTIFYAAIVYALFAIGGVPGAVRRRLRHKRGQCASCGYSLRESASEKCPECGATA